MFYLMINYYFYFRSCGSESEFQLNWNMDRNNHPKRQGMSSKISKNFEKCRLNYIKSMDSRKKGCAVNELVVCWVFNSTKKKSLAPH